MCAIDSLLIDDAQRGQIAETRGGLDGALAVGVGGHSSLRKPSSTGVSTGSTGLHPHPGCPTKNRSHRFTISATMISSIHRSRRRRRGQGVEMCMGSLLVCDAQ
jgi:hypothetical protein